MGSITYWNRLEPRARSTDVANALAARVRDPAWFLARQWQFGELEGADGGSPAYLRIATRVVPMDAWSADVESARATAIDTTTPVEAATIAEAASPRDLALAVQLGQTFDRMLRDASAGDLRRAFLDAYPIAPTDAADDPRARRLRALWHGRAIDGLALYAASQRTVPAGAPPAGVPASVPGNRRDAASTAVKQLATWVRSVVGEIGTEDPAAWRPAQLDYAVRVYASEPATATPVALTAVPDRSGDLAWYSFEATSAPAPITPSPAVTVTRAVIPGPVRFRGMPNERFWDFEDGRVDFGGLSPDRRGLASLLLADFMLVHSNDWFLAPLELPVGSLCSSALTMVDVFGDPVEIPRADADAPGAARPWTMFSTSTSTGGPAGFFVLPATAAGTVIDGPPLEEVRFLRDDTAAVAWAVERTIESSVGTLSTTAADLPSPGASGTGLAYRITNGVPASWIPFVPVKLATSDEVVLERAAMLSLDTGTPTLPPPRGRILEPTSLPAGSRYRMREEIIPREGVQVVRRNRFVRGIDGVAHVWTSRARSVGTGEGWSGLRFDLVIDE